MRNTYTNRTKNQTEHRVYKSVCVFGCIFENPSHILSITKAVIVSNFIEKKRECVKYVQYRIHTAHIQNIHTRRQQTRRTEYREKPYCARCVTHKGYILNNIVRVASHCLNKSTHTHTYTYSYSDTYIHMMNEQKI